MRALDVRSGCGAAAAASIGLTASFSLEIILSALYAPVLMLIQSRHVFEVFMGRDSGWKPQRRDGGGTTWRDAWLFHNRHMLLSCHDRRDPLVPLAAAARLGFAGPAGFVARRCPLSRASGSESLGRALSRFALLRTPEEVEPPALVARRTELIAKRAQLPEDGLRYLARNRDARLAHIDGNLPRPSDPRGHPDPQRLHRAAKADRCPIPR